MKEQKSIRSMFFELIEEAENRLGKNGLITIKELLKNYERSNNDRA